MFRKPVTDGELTYWRSRSQFEVDFVVGDQLGVEVKSKARFSPRNYKGLLALGEEATLKRKLVVCGEKQRRRAEDGVEILRPRDFFRELWARNLLDWFMPRRRSSSVTLTVSTDAPRFRCQVR